MAWVTATWWGLLVPPRSWSGARDHVEMSQTLCSLQPHMLRPADHGLPGH